MYNKFCHYGVNCKKGHHGIDAICSDDLFTGICNCNPNASDKILELEEEINTLKSSEDGFTMISKERQNQIKKLSTQISNLKSQLIVHLNRDKLITDKISSTIRKISENDFDTCLPISNENNHYEIIFHENSTERKSGLSY
jgi:hypothetical protein